MLNKERCSHLLCSSLLLVVSVLILTALAVGLIDKTGKQVWHFLGFFPPQLEHDTPSNLLSPPYLRGLTVESNYDLLFSLSHSPQQNHANNESQNLLHKQRFAVLNNLICEDRTSMSYFYWRQSWQWPHCPYAHDKYEESLGRKVIPGKPIVPIFVIFNDKITDLKEFLRSMHTEVQSSFQIVIIETVARIPEAVEFVDWLREHHLPVVYSRPILNDPWALNNVAGIIDRYMVETPESKFYVVTDPDLSLQGTRENILEVFADILDEFKDIPVVGPALRIDDIPNDAFTSNLVWFAKKGAVDWELKFWPGKLNSVFQAARKQRIYLAEAEIDTTFAMYRRGFKWHRDNFGYRVIAPYEMRHVDWYFSPTTGVPKDMIKYTCLKWSDSVSHVQFPNCPALLKLHNISEDAGVVQTTDEKLIVFNQKRLERVIGRHTPLHIKVGNLPTDFKRLTRSKASHPHTHHHGNIGNHTSAAGSRVESTQADLHAYWVELSPTLDGLMLTDRHFIVPYMALPDESAKSEIVDTVVYTNADDPMCDSLFPSKSDFASSKEVFMKEYDTRCDRIEKEIKENPTALTYREDMEVIEVNRMNQNKDWVYGCFAPRTESKRRALSLSYMLSQLAQFPIRMLDIASKGADASLLYSIESRLPSIQHIRCECQRGAWYHRSSVANNCDEIAAFLMKHSFTIDSVRLVNCGLEEYVLQASKKVAS